MSLEIEKFNEFQEVVGENHVLFIEEVNNLKIKFINRKRKTRQEQLTRAKEKTNYSMFLRLYVMSRIDFPEELLHFDDEDKDEKDSFGRFLNIIVNEDENYLKSDIIFVEYKMLRLETNPSYSLGRRKINDHEKATIKKYQIFLIND